LNVYLFIHVSKGFFPQQDNGRMMGSILGDQDTSFQAMDRIVLQMVDIIDHDPAVETVQAFTGGSNTNTARMFVNLKPRNQRKLSVDLVIARLRPKLLRVPGASLYLQASQDV
jgi:multidrug efflux pump